MMMLVAAKWRDFSNMNPHAIQPESDAAEESDYAPKTSRSRSRVSVFRRDMVLVLYCMKSHKNFFIEISNFKRKS